MRQLWMLAGLVAITIFAGCDTGPATGSSSPTEITPERQAEIDAHDKAVEDEEKAHQASGN